MKSIRLTKDEAEWLRWLLRPEEMNLNSWSTKHVKMAASMRAKLDAAEAPSGNADVGPIEKALVAGSRGKVIEMDRSGYGRASVQAGRMGVTPEDAGLVGRWLATQGWLRGPLTLLTVLNKWPDWAAKARASQPPEAALPGFGASGGESSAEAKAGASRPSEDGTPGRPAPGFRR